MLSLGSAKRHANDEESNDYIIRGSAMKMHIVLLLLGPPVVFTTACYRRIMSSTSFVDVWLDLVLSLVNARLAAVLDCTRQGGTILFQTHTSYPCYLVLPHRALCGASSCP
jgi:hypothetical protein